MTELNEKKDKAQYAVKFKTVKEYAEFAEWITKKDEDFGYERRYRLKPNVLNDLIEDKLNGLAMVYENCAEGGRQYDKKTDKIRVERDQVEPKKGKEPKKVKYPVAVPMEICETMDGDIDLSYLKNYVAGLKGLTDHEAAYALLGMYFLSRCR